MKTVSYEWEFTFVFYLLLQLNSTFRFFVITNVDLTHIYTIICLLIQNNLMHSLTSYGNVWRDSFSNKLYTWHHKAVLCSRSNDAHPTREEVMDRFEIYLNLRVYPIY